MSNSILSKIITLGPIGYWPASGTWASFCTLIIIGLLDLGHLSYAVTIFIAVQGIFAALSALPVDLLKSDAAEIVVDEVAGMCMTFIFIVLSPARLLIGFLIFRFFDITKWFGIRYLERISGAYGVLADDIIAGLLSNIILQGLIFYGII